MYGDKVGKIGTGTGSLTAEWLESIRWLPPSRTDLEPFSINGPRLGNTGLERKERTCIYDVVWTCVKVVGPGLG